MDRERYKGLQCHCFWVYIEPHEVESISNGAPVASLRGDQAEVVSVSKRIILLSIPNTFIISLARLELKLPACPNTRCPNTRDRYYEKQMTKIVVCQIRARINFGSSKQKP